MEGRTVNAWLWASAWRTCRSLLSSLWSTKAARPVLILSLLWPLVGCYSAGERASRGAFDEIGTWWEREGKAKTEGVARDVGRAAADGAVAAGRAQLDAAVAAAKAKPDAERTATDWFLILLGGGASTGVVWTLLQRYLLGHRGAAAATIAAELARALTPTPTPPTP